MKRATLALAAVMAVPVAYAQAHEGTHAEIHGPSKLGTVQQNSEHNFLLPGVSVTCPGPEDAPPCRVVATVRTASRVRVKPGEKKRVVTLGRTVYNLHADRDHQTLHPIHLNETGDKLLARYGGRIGARALVEAGHKASWVNGRTLRNFRFTLADHE